MSQCWNYNAMVNPKWAEIPVQETDYVQDEPTAIVDVDGGHGAPGIRLVEIKMDSAILGMVDVIIFPDQAVVGGVTYTNSELADLLSRGLRADDLIAIHRFKKEFPGEAISKEELDEIEVQAYSWERWWFEYGDQS